jgi:GntR family transcriptional repressor for pyruvate dehydrogenase complex
MLGRVQNSPSGDMRHTSGAVRNVTETVVARIEELVLGELSPGTELPSESELAAVRRDPRRLLDLLDVRRALEVHIASLAAANPSRAAVSVMETALTTMRDAAAEGPDAIHDADIRFHEGLAAASGNQMLSFLIEAMEGPLHAGRMRSLRGHLARGGTVEDVIEQHARILDRVRARDPGGAAAAMSDHLEQTARDLSAALMSET